MFTDAHVIIVFTMETSILSELRSNKYQATLSLLFLSYTCGLATWFF